MPFRRPVDELLMGCIYSSTIKNIRKKYPIRPNDFYFESSDWSFKKMHYREIRWLDSSPKRESTELIFDNLEKGWILGMILDSAYICFEYKDKLYYCLENGHVDLPDPDDSVAVVTLDYIVMDWISRAEAEKIAVEQKRFRERATIVGLFLGFISLRWLL